MAIENMVTNLSPEVYERLKTAVETGKWPDGAVLSDEQKAQSLQLVMAYQAKVLKSTEHFTVGADGEIVNRNKSELKTQFKQQASEADQDAIARFNHDDL